MPDAHSHDALTAEEIAARFNREMRLSDSVFGKMSTPAASSQQLADLTASPIGLSLRHYGLLGFAGKRKEEQSLPSAESQAVQCHPEASLSFPKDIVVVTPQYFSACLAQVSSRLFSCLPITLSIANSMMIE
jgi:hypothetical protein